MTAAFAVQLRGLGKSYGATPVLRGLDLDVTPGERIVVCGPSGSGKSTLLRCINGLETHQQGTVTVDGIRLTSRPRTLQQVRLRVGMVFQGFNLFQHMTVLENCMLAPMRALGVPAVEAERLAIAQLERVHVGPHRHKYPRQLSGGQQQRVAIARALCMRPRLMLFDEPTSALDPEMVGEVQGAMTELADAGMTMLCVTHELGFARRVASRVLFMDRGELRDDCAPEAFFAARGVSPRARAFLGHFGVMPPASSRHRSHLESIE